MSKIITLLIKFLNRINKFTWKIIIFLSRFIKVEDIIINNKPTNEKYRQFKVDDPAVIEPFVKIEHKDYKQLTIILNRLNVVMTKILLSTLNALAVVLQKNISTIIMVNKLNLNVKFSLMYLPIILLRRMMLF